jgi:hypothetical protein
MPRARNHSGAYSRGLTHVLLPSAAGTLGLRWKLTAGPERGLYVVRSRPQKGGWAAATTLRFSVGLGAGQCVAGLVFRIFLVARIGFSATTSREPRQGRKAAAAAAMSGAGVPADAGHLLGMSFGIYGTGAHMAP